MDTKYYCVMDYRYSSPLCGIYINYDDAKKEAIDRYIIYFDPNNEFFKLNSFDEMLKWIYTCADISIIEIMLNSFNVKFNFNDLLRINKYNYIDGTLITNIGVFEISEKDFVKFEKLIIFK